MGNSHKKLSSDINLLNHVQINICSLYANLTMSVLVENKILSIVNLFFDKKYDIDILCLQGILDTKLCRIILKQIYEKSSKIYAYPSLDTFGLVSNNSLELTLSRSNDEIQYIDCLTLSKYPIINSAKVKLTNDLIDYDKFIYISNIEVYDTVISIYNFELQADSMGRNNKNIRLKQLNEINDTIKINKEKINNDEYILYNNNLHFLCTALNVDELRDKQTHNEYIDCLKKINGLDLYRYVRTLKGQNTNNSIDSTNINGKRSEYILLILDSLSKITEIESIKNILYNEMKIIVKNNLIIKNLTDLDNYAILSLVLIKKDTTKPKKLIKDQAKEIK